MIGANPCVLKVEHLSVGYGDLEVLHGIELGVGAGEVVALMGANGAGKSTLLAALSGLLRPRAGTIRLCGQDVTHFGPERLVRLGLSHVPERRQVFATMTTLENLLLGAHHRLRRVPRHVINADLEAMFAMFPVLSERRNQLAGTLSGGQQQMLAIARGLMARPRVLLLDEPSLGLAPQVMYEIFHALADLPARGCAVLLVEQNARAALQVANRGYVLEVGRVASAGSAEDLAADPHISSAYLGKWTRADRGTEPAVV